MRSRTLRPSIALALAGGAAVAARAAIRRSRRIDFAGLVVLITGGSRGLGLVLAREFGRHGARVVVCARTEGDLARARQDLVQNGVDALAVACDVTRRDESTRSSVGSSRSVGTSTCS